MTWWRTWRVAMTLAAIAVALTAAALAVRGSDGDAESRGERARTAASAVAAAFFTHDHADPDRSLDAVAARATGEFATQLATRRDQLRADLAAQKLTITGTVPTDAAALEHLTSDRAWILVSVDVATAGEGQEPTQARYRTRLRMDLVDGEWLAAEMEQVG